MSWTVWTEISADDAARTARSGDAKDGYVEVVLATHEELRRRIMGLTPEAFAA